MRGEEVAWWPGPASGAHARSWPRAGEAATSGLGRPVPPGLVPVQVPENEFRRPGVLLGAGLGGR
jgi:hypothetical protein